jgi:hypothetical protein
MAFNKTSSALTTLCKTGCQLLQVSKSLYKVRLELPLSGLTPSQSQLERSPRLRAFAILSV